MHVWNLSDFKKPAASFFAVRERVLHTIVQHGLSLEPMNAVTSGEVR